MKRYLALLLAAMLVIGDTVPAFAQTPSYTTASDSAYAETITETEAAPVEEGEAAPTEEGMPAEEGEVLDAAADGIKPEGPVDPDESAEQEVPEDPKGPFITEIAAEEGGYLYVEGGSEPEETQRYFYTNWIVYPMTPNGNRVMLPDRDIQAFPNEGMVFAGWKGSYNDNPLWTEGKRNWLKAEFVTGIRVDFVVEAEEEGAGEVHVHPIHGDYREGELFAPGTKIIEEGSELYIESDTLTDRMPFANAYSLNENYVFLRWSGIPADGILTENTTITAVFEKTGNPAVSVSATEGGSISPSESFDVAYKTAVTEEENKLTIGEKEIIATPEAGYRFDHWTFDPALDAENRIIEDTKIQAVFREKINISITNQPDNQTVYSSATAKFSVKADGYGTLSYQWEWKPKNYTTWNTITAGKSASMEVSTNYYGDGCSFRCTITDSNGSKAVSNEVKLTVVSEPKISSNPSAATVYEGDSAAFSVKASGYNLSYQWQELAGDGSWSDIAGATALTYSFKAVYAQSGHSFRLKVTDGLGTVLYSNEAGLTVYRKPVITAQPADSIVASGATATFTVTAAYGCGSLTYQWQRKLPSSSSWSSISESSAKKASYQVTVNATNDAYQYRCVVTDSKGTSVTSNAAKLTVYTKPSISSNPGSVNVYAGDKVELRVTANGTVVGYQWQQLPVNGSWSDIAGATGATYSFTAEANKSNYQYRCKVIGMYGSEAVSSAARVTVAIKFAITIQPKSVTAERGTTVIFSVGAEGGNGTLSYQWQEKRTSSSSWKNISSSRAEKASYQDTANINHSGYQYRCVVTDSKGASVTSNAAQLTVYTRPSISSNPGSVNVYAGDKVELRVTASGTVNGYQWQQLPVNGSWSDIAGATGTAYSFTAETNKNNYQYRCKVIGMYGSEAVSSAAKVTVAEKLTITAQPQSVTADRRDTVTFTVGVEGGIGTLSYQWQYKKPSSSYWNTINESAAKKASYQDTANINHSGYQYRCVVTDSKGASVTSNAAQLTVYTKPSISSNPGSVNVYAGDKVELRVTASGTVNGYQWQQLPVNGSWSDIAGATGTTYSFTAEVNKNNYQYRCKVIGMYGSEAVSSAAKVTVAEKLELAITSQPQSVTADRRDTVTFTVGVKGGIGTLSYQWQYKKPSSSYWNTINESAAKKASYQLSLSTVFNGYQYRCVVTDSKGASVTSNAAQLTVYTKPSISSNPGSVNVYAGDKVELRVTARGTVKGYQWQQLPVNGSWSDIAGATGTAYSFTAEANKSNYQYRCKVIGMYGSEAVSSAAKVAVAEKLELAITSQPQSVTIEENDTVTFTVGVEGGIGTIFYQWQYRESGSSSWKNISVSGAKGASYQWKASTGYSGYQYRCVVTDSKGTSVTSDAANLTVYRQLRIFDQSKDVTTEAGKLVSFWVTAGGAEFYQWQTSTDGTNWVNCTQTSADTRQLLVRADSSTFGRSYRCIVSNSFGKKLTSNAFKLREKQTVRIIIQPVSTIVKRGEYATFTVGAIGDGLTYDWQYYSTGEGWRRAGVTTAELKVKARSQGRYYCIVMDKYGNITFTNHAYLTVK